MRCFKLIVILLVSSITMHAQDASTLYQEGLAFKNNKQSAQALEKFRQAAQLKPDYVEALYEMGWCQNDTKDYRGALISFRKAAKYWSTIPKLYFETGYALEKTDQYDSAIAYYNKTLSLKSDYTLAYKQLGTVYYIRENYTLGLENFGKYINLKTGDITDYLFWYRKGFMENATKDFVSAKQSLAKSLNYKTDYINTYLEYGFACNKLKEGDEAIHYYQKAIDIDPQSHIPLNGIAEVYRDTKKDISTAKTWYQKALDVKPNERKAEFGMGYCLNSQDDFYGAIPHLKSAIESEPTYTAAHVELGYSYYKTGQLQLAKERLFKGIELNDKNINARYYLGLIYLKEKNKTKAQQMVNELTQLGSKEASGLQQKVNEM